MKIIEFEDFVFWAWKEKDIDIDEDFGMYYQNLLSLEASLKHYKQWKQENEV